jgi:hypothetical protein
VPEQNPQPSGAPRPQGAQRKAAPPATTAQGKPAQGKTSPVDDSEYQFLPVECPKCHFEGKVKISRLDRTFTCKQCKKVFHVTLDGTVSGERPQEAAVDPSQFVTEEPQGPITKFLESLPRAWQMVLFGLGALALAYGVSVLMEPAKPLPGEIEDRAKFAGQALAKGEWKQLKRLAKAKTSGDLGRWFDLVRPKDWADVGADASVNVEVGTPVQQLRGYEKEKPLLDSVVPITVEPAGKSKLAGLALYFSQDNGADWWLDGERMLSDAALAKKPARKPDRKPMPKAAK